MDASVDHSDSDSGDSWTLLEPSPAYANEVPDFSEIYPNDNQNMEKDEDTDGISIISESEPESPTPDESNKLLDDIPFEQQVSQYVPMDISSKGNDNMLSETKNNFLVDNTIKHKTYVHRRNKRLSTVLNIIVLGSVITAAGVAIGHMWGVKNDCSINTTPSVNKILSNLYKLQEENSYLKSKIKELTLMNNVHAYYRKSGTESLSKKPNKCKKVFENSLYNINTDIKCVDNDDSSRMAVDLMETEHEKEFLHDIEKLKNIYRQNKSWLDNKISKTLNHEELTIKSNKNDVTYKKQSKESPQLKGEKLVTINEVLNNDMLNSEMKSSYLDRNTKNIDNETERKISYADSLKSEIKKIPSKLELKEPNRGAHRDFQENNINKRNVIDKDTLSGHSTSEDEIRKYDRYTRDKYKQEKKKHDRQKLHKKQKRKNKYEQWEMKGGYLKDYDDFSLKSHENEYLAKNSDKNLPDKIFEGENYIEQFLNADKRKKALTTEHDKNLIKLNDLEKKSKGKEIRNNEKNKENQTNWFDKRAILRKEARKKLERELFGESTPNNAGWYFRRMQRREQCCAKGENSTYRKLSKRNMNFNTKH